MGKRHWYATTDADTEVGGDWLVRQLGSGADMVLGLVRVGQWRHHSEQVAELYEARYRAEAPLHQHIHGANMGFRSEAYWRVGGFAALASGEDVDLVDRFRAADLHIAWDDRLWVTTSDRAAGHGHRTASPITLQKSLKRSSVARTGGRGVMTTALVLDWLRTGQLAAAVARFGPNCAALAPARPAGRRSTSSRAGWRRHTPTRLPS